GRRAGVLHFSPVAGGRWPVAGGRWPVGGRRWALRSPVGKGWTGSPLRCSGSGCNVDVIRVGGGGGDVRVGLGPGRWARCTVTGCVFPPRRLLQGPSSADGSWPGGPVTGPSAGSSWPRAE